MPNYKMQGNGNGQEYNLVSDLIDHNTRKWKDEIITDIMTEDEERKVISIPLSRYYYEDSQA